ncbi:MAG: recombinase RecA [Polyangiaceae bacterium]|nr:recombinase RecA [Polyangiaceae bacterium]
MKNTKEPNPKSSEIASIIGDIEKNFGKGAIMQLGAESTEPIETFSTGALSLDEALGVGGYPRGRIIEIYGPESSGKTTLTLHALAQAQAKGCTAAFIDAEHAFDVRYAKALGVNLESLLISQPDCGEQALDIVEALTRSEAIDLVVVDSVAALVPRAELEGDMGDSHMGLHARLMSQALRKLASLAHKTNTTLIFINQLRQKIGVTFGSPETTTGGNALKFYASVRLDVRRIGKVTVGEVAIGNRTRVKVVKNKCAPPFAEAEFDIRWGTGIDRDADLVELACERGVFEKHGAHLSFAGKSLGQGRDKTRDTVLADPALRQAVTQAVFSTLKCKATTPTSSAPTAKATPSSEAKERKAA